MQCCSWSVAENAASTSRCAAQLCRVLHLLQTVTALQACWAGLPGWQSTADCSSVGHSCDPDNDADMHDALRIAQYMYVGPRSLHSCRGHIRSLSCHVSLLSCCRSTQALSISSLWQRLYIHSSTTQCMMQSYCTAAVHCASDDAVVLHCSRAMCVLNSILTTKRMTTQIRPK